MTALLRVLSDLTACGLALLVILALPRPVASQEPARDTTRASAQVRDLPLTAAQRQTFVGTYTVAATSGSPLPPGETTFLRIFEENGVLMGKPANQDGAKRLLYQGDNVFRPEGVSGFVLTFVVENGRATKFTARKEDGVIEGVRRP